MELYRLNRWESGDLCTSMETIHRGYVRQRMWVITGTEVLDIHDWLL